MFKNFQKGYINFFLLLILITGIMAGVYLIQQTTNLFPKASEKTENTNITYGLENLTITSNGKFGIVMDFRNRLGTPNAGQFQTLQPGWVRFIYFPESRIPSFPQGVKILVVFNYESVPGQPLEKDLLQWEDNEANDTYQEETLLKWNAYVDKYTAALEDFIKEYAGKFDAIEVWNEEDLCLFDYKINKEYFCPKIPEPVYTNMLKQAAAVIKQYSPNTKVVMGGLAKGDIFWEDGGYLVRIQKIDPTIFDQVDAVGLHPYGVSLNNWCTCSSYEREFNDDGSRNKHYCTDNIDPSTGLEKCPKTVPYGNLRENVQKYKAVLPSNVKLWITEIGIGSGEERNQDPLYDQWQKDYMKNVFDYLQNEAEVIIWYAWIDRIQGAGGQVNMGLHDGRGEIKPAGELFEEYSSNLDLE